MKRLSILGMAALTAAAVSCKKSGDDAPAPVQGAFRAVAEAQADDSKTSLNGDLAVTWSANDKIRIFNDKDHSNTNNTSYGDFELISGTRSSSGEFNEPASGLNGSFYSGYYRTFYPAENNATYKTVGDVSSYYMTLPAEQTYTANSFGPKANPMATKAASTSLSFSNLCGTLRLSLTGYTNSVTVKSIKVTSRKAEKLRGEGKVVFGETPALEMTGTGNGENSVTLDCGTAGVTLPKYNPAPGMEPGKQFNIVPPAGSLMAGFDIEVTYSTASKTGLTFKKGVGGTVDNSIQAGRVRNMPALRIDCGFVVSDNFKAVEFAQGNLFYEPAATKDGEGTWGIEPSPWMYGATDVNESTHIGSLDYAHLSYFKWSNIENEVIDQTNAAPTTSTFFTEPDGLKITVNGTEQTYHTLSNEEWEYVINTRPVQTGNHRWAKVYMLTGATSKGLPEKVAGLLLFPAEWKEPATGTQGYTKFTDDAFVAGADWDDDNTVSESDLSGNYASCVFLPCAGYRNGNNDNSVSDVNTFGHYWSSTSMHATRSYDLDFVGSGIDPVHGNPKVYGFTVRPVLY